MMNDQRDAIKGERDLRSAEGEGVGGAFRILHQPSTLWASSRATAMLSRNTGSGSRSES